VGGPEEHQLLTAVEVVEGVANDVFRFHVTGASGWFGRTLLELLGSAMTATEFDARVRGYASRRRVIRLSAGNEIELLPLEELPTAVGDDDLIAHFAYRTREQAAEDVKGYIADNVEITTTVAAAIEGALVRGVFTTSSGAVYGADGALVHDLYRDPYGTLKHLDELVVQQLAAERGASCAIARVFAVSGEYMTKPDRYALGDLIRQVAAGGPVHIQATSRVIRSYSAVADVVAVGLAAASGAAGWTSGVFDSGGDEIEIEDLARRIAAVLGRPVIEVQRSDITGPTNRYVSDGRSFDEVAQRFSLRPAGLDEQIEATARYLLGGPAQG
jgi:nucleoside-diphosphate-sugar epimerase